MDTRIINTKRRFAACQEWQRRDERNAPLRVGGSAAKHKRQVMEEAQWGQLPAPGVHSSVSSTLVSSSIKRSASGHTLWASVAMGGSVQCSALGTASNSPAPKNKTPILLYSQIVLLLQIITGQSMSHFICSAVFIDMTNHHRCIRDTAAAR